MRNTNLRRRVIYVASIYHSGSTLFDLVATRINGTLGLGEVFKFFFDGPEEQCSCGVPAPECEFWKDSIEGRALFSGGKSAEYIESEFKTLWSQIESHHPHRVIIDGSKVSPYKLTGNQVVRNHLLHLYRQDKSFDLFTVYLVKDARAWVSSMIRRDLRKAKQSKNLITTVLSLVAFLLMRNWILRYFQWGWSTFWLLRQYQKDQAALFIDYKDLCANPNEVLIAIEKQFALDNIKNLPPGLTHICVGNPSRFNFLTNQTISYDDRWKDSVIVRSIYVFIPLFRWLDHLVGVRSRQSLDKALGSSN
jgi:hypothetical protein